MLRKPLNKIKNPQIGIYSVRYRNRKGTFTGALSSANSFQYLTKSGSFSRPIKIPTEITKTHEKKLFIYLVLGKTINSNEKRKETAAKKAGREYIKKRPEELLAIPLEDVELLRAEFPEIFSRPDEDYYELVSDDEFYNRMLRASKIQKQFGYGLFATRLTARTDGRKTPQLYGESANWVDIQKKLGFIKETTVYEERKRKNKKTGKTTTYKVKKKSYRGDGSIMFFFTRAIREWFLKNRAAVQARSDKTSLHTALKIGVVTDLAIHNDYMLSDQTFLIPKKLGARAYKTRIDGIVWGMAKECFRMINNDFPFDDEPKGGLTSDDVYTKIRFNEQLDKLFSMFVSIVAVPHKTIPKWLKVNEHTGYLKSKAFYGKDEE